VALLCIETKVVLTVVVWFTLDYSRLTKVWFRLTTLVIALPLSASVTSTNKNSNNNKHYYNNKQKALLLSQRGELIEGRCTALSKLARERVCVLRVCNRFDFLSLMTSAIPNFLFGEVCACLYVYVLMFNCYQVVSISMQFETAHISSQSEFMFCVWEILLFV
jgi:hypothetical protein